MMDMCAVLIAFIVEPDSSKKGGRVKFLLHIVRLDQPVTEAALQNRQDALQGVLLMVQHRWQFSHDPSVTHLLH